MNIVSHFFQAAESYPQAIAIVDRGRSWTFAQLALRIQQTAAALQARGIRPNDNVMVLLPVSTELYVHILALFQLGARVVLVDALRPKSRIAYAYQKANCQAIVTNRKVVWLRYFLLPRSLWRSVLVVRPSAQAQSAICPKVADDTALITFTSGSTGQPKAADRTHGFLGIQLATLTEEMQLRVGDVHLTSFPVVLMCNLAVGATSIIPPAYRKRRQWGRIAQQYAPSIISAAPFHFKQMLPRVHPSQLSRAFIGGATLLPDFAQWVTEQIPQVATTLVYGSTEAEPISTLSLTNYLSLVQQRPKGVPVGQAHPNIRLHINTLDAADFEPLPEGQVGEIWVAGPHVADRYYQDEAAFAAQKVRHGGLLWHRTGDAGYVQDGTLYYYGRMKHLWRSEQELHSPVQAEFFLGLHRYAPGTWLRLDGENVLFTEPQVDLEGLRAAFPHRIDRTVVIKQLPRDGRHRSRVDYGGLVGNYFNST